MDNDTLTTMVLVEFILIMLVGIMQFFLYTMMKYVHDMANIDGKRIDAIVLYIEHEEQQIKEIRESFGDGTLTEKVFGLFTEKQEVEA